MLKDAAKDVLRRAKQLQEEGRMPLVLGTEGLIALMWDKFQRALDHLRNETSPTYREEASMELLTMVAEGLVIYYTHTKDAYKNLAERRASEDIEMLSQWEETDAEEENEEEQDEGTSEGDGGD